MHSEGLFPGLDSNGGYAEALKTSVRNLVKLPNSLAPKDVAPYSDAGLTAYRVVKKATRHLMPGEYCVVIGAGGLGHIGIQCLKAMCASEVIVVDISDTSLELAKQSGAEVLILGSAKTTVTQLPLMKSSGMKTCNANLNLRAVRADDAVIIATTSARGVAAHIDDLTGSTMALEKASKEAAESLKASIIEKYSQNQFESRQIQFEVSGITSFQQLNTLKNSLPYYIRGIKNVYQRNFEAGRALFDIEITQKAESVASEMANKTIENISLEITAVTQNKVSARIKEQTTNEGM